MRGKRMKSGATVLQSSHMKTLLLTFALLMTAIAADLPPFPQCDGCQMSCSIVPVPGCTP